MMETRQNNIYCQRCFHGDLGGDERYTCKPCWNLANHNLHNWKDALSRYKFHLKTEHPADWKSHGSHGGIGSLLEGGGKLNSSYTDGCCCLSEKMKNQNKGRAHL